MSNDGLVFAADMAKPLASDMRLPAFKRRVGYAEEDRPHLLEYSEKHFQGQIATVLPLTDDMGRVPGASNIFGRIVMGKSYRGAEEYSGPLAPEVVADFERIIKTSKAGKRHRKEKADLTVEERKAIVNGEKTVNDVAPSSRKSIADVLEEAGEFEPLVPTSPVSYDDVETGIVATPVEDVLSRIMNTQAPPPPVKRRATVTATIDTPWCDVEGKYVDVIVDDKLVVLIADPEYNVFTPKPSQQKLTIRTGHEEYVVVYYGMSYEYEGNVHQIYVRS